jgi:CheY-like chemotaxis protein/signal transduction histidine kinase
LTIKKFFFWGAMAIYGLGVLYLAYWYVQSLMAVTVAMHRNSKGAGNTPRSLVEELPSTPFLTIQSLGEQASALVEAKTKKFEIFSAQKQRESEIAGTVAHEYGNNIMVIQGLLMTGIDALKSGEYGDTLNYQRKALSACDDAKAIVAPLRESGQPARNRKVTGISLKRVLQEETSKLAAEDNQQIDVNLDPECMGVLVDECDFLSIIRNLLMNAQDSNCKVNKTAISLSTHPLERLDSEIVMGLLGKTEEGAEFVCIEVGDEGIGISEEIGNSVFNLGYSTKSEQERKRQPGAKGCGLHIVWNKVKENGGVIDFVRNATGGVTFRVFLPKAMKYEIELPTRPDELSKSPLEGGEILLVEDNSQVREVVELMLKARGYTTFAVANAEAALLQVKRREGKNPFCTIISDINLGVDCMSGLDLVSELRAIQCMVPVLLITAYHAYEISKDLDSKKYNYRLLEKPFTPIELYAMLDFFFDDDDEHEDGVGIVVVDDGSSLDDDDDGDDGSGLDEDDGGGGGGDLEEVFSG